MFLLKFARRIEQKKEIRPMRSKPSNKKSALTNCKNIEQLARQGNFESLVIAEGYHLIGLQLGYWSSVSGMFTLLRSAGLSYSSTSYCRFKSGEYYYLPNLFLSVLASVCACPYPVAHAAGLPLALRVVSRHPDRWVLPSYVEASQLAA